MNIDLSFKEVDTIIAWFEEVRKERFVKQDEYEVAEKLADMFGYIGEKDED